MEINFNIDLKHISKIFDLSDETNWLIRIKEIKAKTSINFATKYMIPLRNSQFIRLKLKIYMSLLNNWKNIQITY